MDPSQYVPITIDRIVQTEAYTLFLLDSPNKKFEIYTSPDVGESIQMDLQNKKNIDPNTLDLLKTLCRGLKIKPIKMLITKVENDVFFSRLIFEQTFGNKKQIMELDARPSDCFALVLLDDVPIVCHKGVLDVVMAYESD